MNMESKTPTPLAPSRGPTISEMLSEMEWTQTDILKTVSMMESIILGANVERLPELVEGPCGFEEKLAYVLELQRETQRVILRMCERL